jgi:hypothetical protein
MPPTRTILPTLLALAACGEPGPAPAPAARRAAAAQPPTIEAQPVGADDPVVARVDGRPVYGSCVQAQAAALELAPRAALDQCIAFELLAGAADARGLRGDPDVIEAWRRELVRAVVRADLEPLDELSDLPPKVQALAEERSGGLTRLPPTRGAHYVRVVVPKQAAPDGPEDRAARAVAEAVYAELKDAPAVLPDELRATAQRHAGGLKVDHNTQPYFTHEDPSFPGRIAVEPFREALFAIPSPGRISPPTRTPWGWDVLLYWDWRAERDLTRSLFQSARNTFVSSMWVQQLAASLGLRTEIDQAALATLAGAEEPAEPPPGAPPAAPPGGAGP